MSSRDGFARADVDTNLMHDPKVLALARRLGDHTRTAAALVLYTSTVLASWKARARLTIAESAPAWWLGDPLELLPDLVAVGLLEEDGRLPAHAFDGWTARAREASDQAAEAARIRWLKHHAGAAPNPEPAQEAGDDAAAMLTHSVGYARPAGLPAGLTAGTAGRAGSPPGLAREGEGDGAPSAFRTVALAQGGFVAKLARTLPKGSGHA